tara:strand:+ start:619 stop:1401 length:783 start_codon:yes stop_codon:yes gene_type:complete
MYRFSTGLKYSGSTEKSRSYLILQSNETGVENLNSDSWKYAGEKPSGTRIYESKFYGQLNIFKKPLDDKLANTIFNELDEASLNELHPALSKGFENEPKRLFPEIDKTSNAKFSGFINFLNLEFDLEKNSLNEIKQVPYSDDIGPFMLGFIGDRSFVVPEIPNIYLAPPSWRLVTWYINNYFSGPYPNDNENKNLERFHWNKLKLDPIYQTKQYEGIAYFLIAKFIIIYEAFSNNHSCTSLNLFIDSIQDVGLRPWKKLF